MGGNVRILRPLGTCKVGDFLGVEIDGLVIEGQITFLSRTPTGGWIITLESGQDTCEVYCHNGICNLVSQIAEAPRWTFEELESSRPVVDTGTGRRLSALRR